MTAEPSAAPTRAACVYCGGDHTRLACPDYRFDEPDERAVATRDTWRLNAEIEARRHPPHLDGDRREGIFRGLVLARHIHGGECDPGECESHERDLLTPPGTPVPVVASVLLDLTRDERDAARAELNSVLQPLVNYLMEHHATRFMGNHCIDVALDLLRQGDRLTAGVVSLCDASVLPTLSGGTNGLIHESDLRALLATGPGEACSTCGGSGLVDWDPFQHRYTDEDQQPCPDCLPVEDRQSARGLPGSAEEREQSDGKAVRGIHGGGAEPGASGATGRERPDRTEGCRDDGAGVRQPLEGGSGVADEGARLAPTETGTAAPAERATGPGEGK